MAVPAFDPEADSVDLWGHSQRDRHRDEELAGLAGLAGLRRLMFHRQPITRLPALHPSAPLESLSLLSCDRLASLEGIEAYPRITDLLLEDLPRVDQADAFARLRELPELTKLELRKWRSIPAIAGELPSLRVLRFRDCRMLDVRSVCAAFADTPTLRSLCFESAAHRVVTRVPAEIGNMTSLDELLIAGATRVPAQLGRLARLETLRLAGGFQRIPEQLGSLVNLRRLAISAKRLRTLPRSIGKLAALEELDVHAPIAELPDEIGDLAALRTLDVRSTRIKVLPASIDRLAQLQTLHVPPGLASRG